MLKREKMQQNSSCNDVHFLSIQDIQSFYHLFMRNDKSKSLKRPSIQYIFFCSTSSHFTSDKPFIYIPWLNFQTFVILAASKRVDDDNQSTYGQNKGRLLEDSGAGRPQRPFCSPPQFYTCKCAYNFCSIKLIFNFSTAVKELSSEFLRNFISAYISLHCRIPALKLVFKKKRHYSNSWKSEHCWPAFVQQCTLIT